MRVLDIAAGHGVYGIGVAKLNPEARITALLASPHASTRQAAATALGLLPLEFSFFPTPGNAE